jgi:hypothetical protein
VRRTITLLLAFLGFAGTILVLPVYAKPLPQPKPVATSTDELDMGSVQEPAADAEVQEGTTEPVRGVPDTAPTLTLKDSSTESFSLVGVTWAYDPAVTDTLVKIRVRNGDRDWSDWTQVSAESSDQDSGGRPGAAVRGGTSPLWTGPSTGVEVELVTRSGAQPTDVRLDLVDPGKSAADTALTTPGIRDTAHAAQAMPPVYSRAQWGADDSIRTWAPEYAPTIKAATIHHTADSNDYTTDQVPSILRSIYRYHAVSLGWGDIGYNVIVDKFGRLWEGRYGGLASTVIGAHAGGFNTGTFGVSMLGNYDLVDTTKPMIDAVAAIIGWKFSLYGVDPNGMTTLVSAGGGTAKYPAGTAVTLPTIFAHRDVGRTVCPGRYGYARMAEIRSKVDGRAAYTSYVTALYQDMMGRGADEAGFAGWTNTLMRTGDRRGVARGFSNSVEYRALVITQAYRQVLGREPDAGGMQTWLEGVASGKVGLDYVRTMFMASPEFYLRGGSSDAAFVTNIYQAALGRPAGQSEIDYWAQVRRRSGPQAVIGAVWGSPEAGMRRVDQAYQYWLGRTAGPNEQQFWLPVVMGSGDEQLREEIVVSQEYSWRAGNRFP